MGTAANMINDHYRHHYAHLEEAITEKLHSDGGNPAQLSEEAERIEAVRKAMVQLTPDQQHVLALRFSSEFSLEETAELMGKNVNAVKALQCRAISALRRLISDLIDQ